MQTDTEVTEYRPIWFQ